MHRKENIRLLFLLAAFALLNVGYFAVQRLVSPKFMVHVPLDDWIPFCEWFVIPYVLWYLYVFGGVVFFFFKEKASLVKMSEMIVAGMGVCLLIYMLFPNGIDFRPTVFPRDNPLTDLVGLLYQNDQPENVFPSIHVLNSLAVHFAVHCSPLLRRHRWVEWVSLVLVVLICLSTVFIKQHSVMDVLGGAALGFLLYPLIWRRGAGRGTRRPKKD